MKMLEPNLKVVKFNGEIYRAGFIVSVNIIFHVSICLCNFTTIECF